MGEGITDLKEHIEWALKIARTLDPNRELALTITKLEEAEMWVQKVK